MAEPESDLAWHETPGDAVYPTPALICAFALHRGRYCTLAYRHDGEHAYSPASDGGDR